MEGPTYTAEEPPPEETVTSLSADPMTGTSSMPVCLISTPRTVEARCLADTSAAASSLPRRASSRSVTLNLSVVPFTSIATSWLRVKKWFSNWVSSACADEDDDNDKRSVTPTN